MFKLTVHLQRKSMRIPVNFQNISMWQSKNMIDNQLPYEGVGTVKLFFLFMVYSGVDQASIHIDLSC